MIQPFIYYNPTRIVLDEGRIAQLPRLIEPHYRILLMMDGGSMRRSGVCDAVHQALEGHSVTEFWNIGSNPAVETARKTVQLGRQEQCDFVLAVGGGSIIDTSKLIIAAMCSDQDPWGVVRADKHRSEHLPLGVVFTIPTTGSEMDSGGVISYRETQEKYSFSNRHPRFAILGPRVPTSLLPYQVACGPAGTFVCVMGQCMAAMWSPLLIDRIVKGVLHTLIEIAPGLAHNHQDVDLMGKFTLCTTVGFSDYLSWDVDQDWNAYYIGHEVTALTGLTHGHTLAIILPATPQVVRHLGKQDKLLQYAARIWGFTSQPYQGEEYAITAAIEATKQFFAKLGLLVTLHDTEVSHEVIDEVVHRFTERDTVFGEYQNMTPKVVRQILELAYE